MTLVFHLSTISTKKEEKNQKKKEITTANSNVNLSFNCVDKREQFRCSERQPNRCSSNGPGRLLREIWESAYGDCIFVIIGKIFSRLCCGGQVCPEKHRSEYCGAL